MECTGTVHYKEPLKSFEIRVGHSPGFGHPSVAILPILFRKRRKEIFTHSLSEMLNINVQSLDVSPRDVAIKLVQYWATETAILLYSSFVGWISMISMSLHLLLAGSLWFQCPFFSCWPGLYDFNVSCLPGLCDFNISTSLVGWVSMISMSLRILFAGSLWFHSLIVSDWLGLRDFNVSSSLVGWISVTSMSLHLLLAGSLWFQCLFVSFWLGLYDFILYLSLVGWISVISISLRFLLAGSLLFQCFFLAGSLWF